VKVTPTIVQQEFIGLTAKVSKCSNSSCKGITGTIVNETRNTFVILQEGKRKTIAKDQAVFHFIFPDGTIVEIDGKALVGRPEERLKKRVRKLW
jgi:ribonuclease P protein subunit POP4